MLWATHYVNKHEKYTKSKKYKTTNDNNNKNISALRFIKGQGLHNDCCPYF